MNADLTPNAKVMIVAASIVSLLVVAPLFWGTILLVALQVYQPPWPAIAVMCMTGFIWSSWLILGGRIQSTALAVSDVLVAVLLGLALTATVSEEPIVAYQWSVLIYIAALSEVALHAVLVLFACLGVKITVSDVESAKLADAQP